MIESKENRSGLTQEILALEISQNTPKRMALHPTPDRRINPIKGVLKKRYVHTFISYFVFYAYSLHSTPDRRMNPIKGMLKKRFVNAFIIHCSIHHNTTYNYFQYQCKILCLEER